MQKKFIFIVILISLLGGSVGGAIGFYWMEQWDDTPEQALLVMPAGTSAVEESPLIAAQAAVGPAVISIVQYVNAVPSGEASLYGNFSDPLREVGGGTGFVVDPSGLALTNRHVVSSDQYVYAAFLSDGTRFDLKVLARDPSSDVAIVQLEASPNSYAAELLRGLPYARLGDSSSLRVGEPVLAIGNALAEYANTTTAGIISATGRKVVASDGRGAVSNLFGLIQTDAAINLGNSGGPLVNLKGEVVAINTALDDGAQGIGFAIPIDDVKPALESYRLYGAILRPHLGVRYFLLTKARARELGLDVDAGAFLFSDPETGEPAVVLDSPASRAGLREGDVIVAVDGALVTLNHPLQDLIGHRQVGDRVTLSVWREGARFDVNVELTNR